MAEGVLDVLQGAPRMRASVAKEWRRLCGVMRSAAGMPAARAGRRIWEKADGYG